MDTKALIDAAISEVNSAQNEPWYTTAESTNEYTKLLFQDAQTRALVAIALELKRFNDREDIRDI